MNKTDRHEFQNHTKSEKKAKKKKSDGNRWLRAQIVGRNRAINETDIKGIYDDVGDKKREKKGKIILENGVDRFQLLAFDEEKIHLRARFEVNPPIRSHF